MQTLSVARLGDFLSAARARLGPDDVGLDDVGQRRVPGLRREEIAMLAGVSTSYYTRLEQGQALHASPQVIDALARALKLSDAERAHVHRLARPRPAIPVEEPAVELIETSLLELLDNVGDTPAMVLGRRRDILGWNAAGHALFAAHLDRDSVDSEDTRPNAVELVFLDAHTRDLYVDWQDKARASVGHLRILAAGFPNDAKLLALIGRLVVESSEFAEIWNENRIKTSSSSEYRMRHPVVGSLICRQQMLSTPEAPDQTLVLCTAPEGSPSRGALSLLTRPV